MVVFLQIIIVLLTSAEQYNHQSDSNGQNDVRKIVVDRPMVRGWEVTDGVWGVQGFPPVLYLFTCCNIVHVLPSLCTSREWMRALIGHAFNWLQPCCYLHTKQSYQMCCISWFRRSVVEQTLNYLILFLLTIAY